MDENAKRYKQRSFDYYCKKTLRNEARDIFDAKTRNQKKETLFSELSLVEQNKLFVFDRYFADEWTFEVLGFRIAVNDEILALALARLSEFRRNIVILAYFLEMPDRVIADLLSSKRANIQYHRASALKELRIYISDLENGEDDIKND